MDIVGIEKRDTEVLNPALGVYGKWPPTRCRHWVSFGSGTEARAYDSVIIECDCLWWANAQSYTSGAIVETGLGGTDQRNWITCALEHLSGERL